VRPAGAEFHLIHHQPAVVAPLAERLSSAVFAAPFSHESHPWGDLWRDVVLPRTLARQGIDVFHGPAFIVPRDTRRFRAVVTIHDLVAFRHSRTVPWHYSAYMRKQIRSSIKRAARIIAISASQRDELLEHTGARPERVRVVHHGVEARFAPLAHPDVAAPVLRRLGIDRPYALFIGNIEPRKNLRRVLAAWERVAAATSGELALVVAGARGWLYRGILRDAARLNGASRPIFAGYVPHEDVPALLAAARALVFPSLYEGFGMPILEAMACGVPVVTSDRGAMREVAGGAAQLVNPLDVDAIATGILRVVQDPEFAKAKSLAGRARAAEFTWQRCAEKTLAVYEEAMEAE
jgi:glycosyltransferase involved in cell wall biosynthesis